MSSLLFTIPWICIFLTPNSFATSQQDLPSQNCSFGVLWCHWWSSGKIDTADLVPIVASQQAFEVTNMQSLVTYSGWSLVRGYLLCGMHPWLAKLLLYTEWSFTRGMSWKRYYCMHWIVCDVVSIATLNDVYVCVSVLVATLSLVVSYSQFWYCMSFNIYFSNCSSGFT